MRQTLFFRLLIFALLLTTGVVVLGAYVRLSDAGLGCPDWPGCYGNMIVPSDPDTVTEANASYPNRAMEADKAWKEMIHRYFAGLLGMLVLALAVIAWRNRSDPRQPTVLPWFLVALIVFQSMLGMLTVTWLLKPLIVMGHLLGGLATLSLLWWLALRTGRLFSPANYPESDRWRFLAVVGLVVVVCQIALGGWTSANYAALACPDFPTCQGRWWPETDYGEAFTLWRGIGVDYEGGVLDNAARVAVHLTHRIGAVVTFLYLGLFGLWLWRKGDQSAVRNVGLALCLVLTLQVALGITTVIGHLPLPVAVAHNAGAALLLLTTVAVNHVLRSGGEPAPWT
ncbi:MAG: COX15/CtaA family protein [Pseudomonadota bacterium]|nr:COX15/CtaA family protein [Pseudomonadota bacterium]